jgi:hypothetical protein
VKCARNVERIVGRVDQYNQGQAHGNR